MVLNFSMHQNRLGGFVKILIALRDSDSVCRSEMGSEIAFLTSFHIILMLLVRDHTLRTTVLDHCKPGCTLKLPKRALKIPNSWPYQTNWIRTSLWGDPGHRVFQKQLSWFCCVVKVENLCSRWNLLIFQPSKIMIPKQLIASSWVLLKLQASLPSVWPAQAAGWHPHMPRSISFWS